MFRRLARRYVKPDDADDIVQQAMLNAHRNLHQFRGDSKITSWIGKIVINFALMHRRNVYAKNNRVTEISEVAESFLVEAATAEAFILKAESLERLHHARCRLKPRLRTVVDLRLADRSLEEIAQTLDVPLGTVKARLSRGIKSMRRDLCRAV